jgi:hypothetical protein
MVVPRSRLVLLLGLHTWTAAATIVERAAEPLESEWGTMAT